MRKIRYLQKTKDYLRRQESYRYLNFVLKHRAYLRTKFHLDHTIGHFRLLIVKALYEKRFLLSVIKQLNSVRCCDGVCLHYSEI